MNIKSGFFNSLDGDRLYDSESFGTIFKGIVSDGVFSNIGNHFSVIATGYLSVLIYPGRAWFNSTWTELLEATVLNVSAANPTQPRYSTVILEINKNDSVRKNTIMIVDGVATESPEHPVLTSTTSVQQYALAHIFVPAGAIEILPSNIVSVVGTAECPYSEIVAPTTNLTDQLEAFAAEKEVIFEAWFEGIQNQLSEDAAGNLQNQIDTLQGSTDILIGEFMQSLADETVVFSLADLGDDILLAGTYPTGQIYRSTDGGVKWVLSQRLGNEVQCRSIVALGNGIVLAGTYPHGQIYKSTDNGETWALIQQLGSANVVYDLAHLGNGVVVAGTQLDGSIYRSTDYGETWALIQQLGTETKIIAVKTIGNDNVLAGTYPTGQIYRSTDGGLTWTLTFSIGETYQISSFTYLGNDVVLAGSNFEGRLYRSINGGISWTLIQTFDGEDVSSLAFLGQDVVVAGISETGMLYRSVDNGITWRRVQRLGVASGITSLLPLDDGIVISGTKLYGHIYRSSTININGD